MLALCDGIVLDRLTVFQSVLKVTSAQKVNKCCTLESKTMEALVMVCRRTPAKTLISASICGDKAIY
jgi:hypothetical protein